MVMLIRRRTLLKAGLLACSTVVPGADLLAKAFSRHAVDAKRVVRLANRYMKDAPITVTSHPAARSAGGIHDFYSEGDYWWPDPNNPDGPYIRRDGYSNPDKFVAHREVMMRLSLAVPALVAAWQHTGRKRYAEHAERHLNAWFVNPQTRMNPSLDYAQAIIGVNTGRGIGMIDTLHLVEVARAVAVLQQRQPHRYHLTNAVTIVKWFSDYLAWMMTSKNGTEERDEKNNHGSCWVLQATEFAQLSGNDEVLEWCRTRFKQVLIPTQIALDGSQPLELNRTKPYAYSLFNLDVLATIAHRLSRADDNLWQYETGDGRSLRKALAFMYPHIRDKRGWSYPPDVEYFNDFPVRHPSLLFGGLALGEQKYLDLWSGLEPDPVVPEIIRNFPIRQPRLWIL
jgi:hypothetical protein